MIKYIVLLTALVLAHSASAQQLRVCVEHNKTCQTITVNKGAITIQGVNSEVSSEVVAAANERMRVLGLKHSIKFFSITPEIAAFSAHSIQEVQVTAAELEQEVNLTEEEYDKLVGCGISGLLCAGSVLATPILKIAAVPVILLSCAGAYYSCKDANRTLDKYIERIQTTMKKLKEKYENAAHFAEIPTAGHGGGNVDGEPTLAGVPEAGSSSTWHCITLPATSVTTPDGDVWAHEAEQDCTQQ